METGQLKIIIVGHVDHGKSTLIGRLLYDTDSLPVEKKEEIRKTSEVLKKKMEFAFVMDALEEERKGGLTIDTTQIFFHTSKRRYVIIDAPGHKEFLKNMLTGTSQAEAGILVVDVVEGVREQTKRHAYLLSMLGIKQICVLINKMDLVGYSKDKFEEVKRDILEFLSYLRITPSFILPVSALEGENLASSKRLSWFKGPTLLEALDNFQELILEEKPLRFPVQDIYNLHGKEIAVGRVESGEIAIKDKVTIFPSLKEATVKEIHKFMVENPQKATYGESIGISLEGGEKLKRGDVLVKDKSPLLTSRITAHLFWFEEPGGEKGEFFTFRCVTQEIPCVIEKILHKFDPASLERVEENASRINRAEVAQISLSLSSPAVIDSFSEIPELGRFILEKEGTPVAGGIISS